MNCKNKISSCSESDMKSKELENSHLITWGKKNNWQKLSLPVRTSLVCTSTGYIFNWLCCTDLLLQKPADIQITGISKDID